MTQPAAVEGQAGPDPSRSRIASPARPSRLLSGIYRDIGLAAVASGLEIDIDQLSPDVGEAVKRGSRYIYLMPRK